MSSDNKYGRQDSDTSGSSSIVDSPIYTKFTGKLLSPHDMEFQRCKLIFFNAALHSCNARAFAIVETVDDVKYALKYCQEHGECNMIKYPVSCLSVNHQEALTGQCPLCVVSGGHSDYGIRNGAFVVSLSNLKKIIVDPQKQIAFVEPGALLGDLDVASVKHNLATPLGTASTVGIGGQALDLGMGFLTPLFGFLIQNVIEYDLVTADGEEIKVNEKSHPDLFWAMKGYGANFGIATRYTIKLHKIPPVMVFYRLLYVGSTDDGFAAINMLLQSCTAVPLYKDIQPVAYDVFQKSCDFLYEGGMHFYQSPGHFLEVLSDEYIDTVVDSLSALNVKDNYCTVVYFSSLGGALKEIPRDSSPFLFKNANWWVGAVGSSAEESGYQKVCTVINGIFTKLQSHAMTAKPSDVSMTEQKLKAIKQKYDPENLFKNNPCNILP
eukprot:gene10196-18873_t